MFELTGRVAVVTGAGSGLGRQFCATLAGAGAAVVAIGRRRALIEETAELVQKRGGACEAVAADVTDTKGIREAIDGVAHRHGRLDILVNNAAVGGRALLSEVGEDYFDRVFATNVKGLLFTAQSAARHMVAGGRGGRIINIASLAAEKNMAGLGVYAASKSAVVHLTRTMAYEWAAQRINVCAISPGYILTDFSRAYLESEAGRACIAELPRRRVGKPADLDGLLLLFASEASDFLTGAVCTADDAQRFVLS